MKTKLQLLILLSLIVIPGSGRAQDAKDKPAIFVCGDSTSKNSGNGKSGAPVAGWGTPIAGFFDPEKVVIKNVGHAGRSSHTYYDGDWPNVLPQIKAGKKILIAAHGNSLRALAMHLDKMTEAEILEFNIPTAIPLVYELDDDLKPIKHYYLGDPAELKARLESVAAQGKAK